MLLLVGCWSVAHVHAHDHDHAHARAHAHAHAHEHDHGATRDERGEAYRLPDVPYADAVVQTTNIGYPPSASRSLGWALREQDS